jgi:opacity protein-like surface antigen
MKRAGPAALAALLLAVPAVAQDEAAVTPGWSGSLTVYGWLPWSNIDATAGDTSRSTDVSFSATDALDALKFAAFLTGEIRHDRFGFVNDFVYTSLGSQRTSSGPAATRVDADLKIAVWTFAGAYRVHRDDRFTVDLYGGGRLYYLDTDLDATGQGPLGLTRSASASKTVVDPVIGARFGARLTESLSARTAADIGGFGVGTELSWNVFAGFGYAFTPRIQGELGFRYLSIDYESGSLDLDMQLYGPAAGVTVKF